MKDFPDKIDHIHGHTKKSMLKVIREKCLDCCVQQHSEVRLCQSISCPLWPYRIGKNPFHKRNMTVEQKRAAAKRLIKDKNND